MKYLSWTLLLVYALSSYGLVHAQAPDKPRKLAFLVGVTYYENENLSKLRYPENDVLRLGKVLDSQGYKVMILTESEGKKSADRLPTGQNIRARLAEMLTGVNRNDLIVIGLAGHGLQLTDQDESFFCPRDAYPATTIDKEKETESFDKPQSLVSITELLVMLKKSGIGEKLLLVDACRTEPISMKRRGLSLVKPQDLPGQTGLLQSCYAGEYAYESEKLDAGHGVFFYHVIKALEKGGAADSKGEVTFSLLTNYVCNTVPGTVTKLFGETSQQNPSVEQNMRGVQHVLARVEAALPVISPKPEVPVVPKLEPIKPLVAPFGVAEAKRMQDLWATQLKKERIETNSVGIKLVLIPAGELTPQNTNLKKINVAKPFRIAETEITQKQWFDVMGTRPWDDKKGVETGPDYPACYISWEDAHEFCEKLTVLERKNHKLPNTSKYRLPTEEEWEWSCRGGAVGNVNFSDSQGTFADYAWFNSGAKQLTFAQEVRKKKGNSFGLYDTLGNISEWCYARGTSPASGANSKGHLRGGDWTRFMKHSYLDARGDSFDEGKASTGFRPVRVD